MTPAHRIHLTATGGCYTPMGWTRENGRPTAGNLAAFVARFEASTREGGANEHLGAVTVKTAKVVRQVTGQTVAEYAAEVAS